MTKAAKHALPDAANTSFTTSAVSPYNVELWFKQEGPLLFAMTHNTISTRYIRKSKTLALGAMLAGVKNDWTLVLWACGQTKLAKGDM